MTSPSPANAPNPTPRFVAYYDDDCGMCQRIRDFIEARDIHRQVRFIGRNQRQDFEHNIDDELTAKTLVVVDRQTGRQYIRSAAVAQLISAMSWPWQPFRMMALPGVSLISDAAYRLVAVNRRTISRFLGLTVCKVPLRRPANSTPNDMAALSAQETKDLVRQ